VVQDMGGEADCRANSADEGAPPAHVAVRHARPAQPLRGARTIDRESRRRGASGYRRH
jgi:hypothetical protein